MIFWKVEEQNIDKSLFQSGFSCTGYVPPPYDAFKLVLLFKKMNILQITCHYFGPKKITSRQSTMTFWGIIWGSEEVEFEVELWLSLGRLRGIFIAQISSFKRGNFSSTSSNSGDRITPFHHNFRPENDVFINFVPITFEA